MIDEINRFVNWMRRRNPGARTWRDYSYDLKQFVAIVGDKTPSDVTLTDIDQFITVQAEKGLQASTINRHLATILSFYTFLSGEMPELVCPVLPHRHHLREPKRLPRPVPEADLQAFFSVIEDERDLAMFLLMLRCGLRICEVVSLQMRDVYLKASPPRLQVMGKNSQERTAYLSPQVCLALKAYLAVRPSTATNSLFLSYQQDGMSTTAVHKRLLRYRETSGVYLTAHQLRHTFANDLVSADVPVTTIQKLMGHSWLQTTQSYIAANDRKVQTDFFGAAEQMTRWQPAALERAG